MPRNTPIKPEKSHPEEAQALKLAGVLALGLRDPATAYQNLDRYDRMMPGDAGIHLPQRGFL